MLYSAMKYEMSRDTVVQVLQTWAGNIYAEDGIPAYGPLILIFSVSGTGHYKWKVLNKAIIIPIQLEHSLWGHSLWGHASSKPTNDAQQTFQVTDLGIYTITIWTCMHIWTAERV